MARPAGKTPLWIEIAAALKAGIGEGQYAPGERLPTEAALAARFGVNRHTVRHALAALIEEGLVRTRRGAGTFVTARPLDYPLGERVRFHENLLAAGRFPAKRTLMIETRPASAAEARRLEVAAGAAICVVHGLSFADGQPVALAESHFPECHLPGIAAAMAEEEGVTAALARVGVADYVRRSTRLSARRASASQAAHLAVQEGAPLLFASSINETEDGVPVEYGQTWFAGDRVTLTLDRGDFPARDQFVEKP